MALSDNAQQHTQHDEIAALLARARSAQRHYAQYTQAQVNDVVTALAWSIVNDANNRELSEMAVADTGLGDAQHKFIKNRRKTMGLLRDLQGARTVGVIAEHPELGLLEIAKPVGVVAAIVPSTNPAATPANKAINALKGGNAVILAPSPKGQRVCHRLVEMMHIELARVGAPLNLVQSLPAPVTKAATQQLMQGADLVVATGSQNNVRAAYASGTPAIGVGAGNVVSIVDETADADVAAQKIITSKTFDNATSCSSENNLIIVAAKRAEMIQALANNDAVLLDAAGKERLQHALWLEGRLNPALIAKSASYIAQTLKLQTPGSHSARVLLVDECGSGPQYPFSGEKLSPVLTVHQAEDFAAAIERACAIMDYQGKGHSIGLHSASDERALQLGLELPVCRVIVNQIHCYATGGSFDNGLPFSLSMGCGTWGKNSTSDNVNYRHYINTTRISRAIPPREPSEGDLFADYWRRYGLAATG